MNWNGSIRNVSGAALALVIAAALMTGCKSPQAAARTDQQVAADVQAKIKGESALANQNIQVRVQSGVATLSGSVSDEASRALAGNDGGSVDGVRTVVNNLTVQAQTAGMDHTQQIPQQYPAPPTPATRDRGSRNDREKGRNDHDRNQNRNQDRQDQGGERGGNAAPQPQPAPPQVAQNPQPVAPPPPPKPQYKTVTLPAGTMLPVRVTETLDSGKSQPNDAFHGALASDIGVQGVIAIPRGTPVQGRILDVKEAAHFKGNAALSVELTDVTARGKQMSVVTNPYTKEGPGRGKNTAMKAGGGAALGALIGGLAGGGKGAAIGAIAGGGAGTGVNAMTRGQQAVISTETVVEFQLKSPVTVTVPLNGQGDQGGDANDPQLQQR